MSAAKHTPGPWEIERRTGSRSGHRAVPSTLNINGRRGAAELVAQVAVRANGDNLPTAVANAELIAAAPDMADALRGLLYAFRECVGRAAFAEFEASNHDVIAARAALAKAGL